MRISHKMAVFLFDSVEAIGIRRDELTAPLGLDAAALTQPRSGLDWDTLVALLEVLASKLGGDVERMQSVGRHMLHTPHYTFLPRLARTVLSLEALYRAGERWLMPSGVPHLIVESWFASPERLHFRCTIPEPYAPSAPYLHILEGLLTAVPTLLGLPPAEIVRSRVTARELALVLDLPRSDALLGRARRAARALWHRREVREMLAQQGLEVVEGLEAAQRAVEEIQSLFDKLPDLVLIHRAGAILWNNRAAAATLGYARDRGLVGMQLLDIVAPSSRSLAASRMHGQADDAPPPAVEGRLLTRDGAEVLVEVFPAQLVRFGGRPARLIVAHDVTERTRLRQQLLAAERMASIGMLAAGVAHEVNNPLAYVLNNVEIALRDLGPLGERAAQSREALHVALEGIDRIRVIVRDLLALSRTEGAAVGAVDVRAAVESTLALAAPGIAERAALLTEYEPVAPARGTPARVGQLVLNLVANALEAMPTTTRAHNQLRVAVRRSAAGGAVIEVSDNGRGVAAEHAPRIFDPFFTTKTFGSGTGLGLTISQRLVTEIGGELSFESTPGRGSTFRVTLAPAEGEEPAPPAAQVTPRAGG